MTLLFPFSLLEMFIYMLIILTGFRQHQRTPNKKMLYQYRFLFNVLRCLFYVVRWHAHRINLYSHFFLSVSMHIYSLHHSFCISFF